LPPYFQRDVRADSRRRYDLWRRSGIPPATVVPGCMRKLRLVGREARSSVFKMRPVSGWNGGCVGAVSARNVVVPNAVVLAKQNEWGVKSFYLTGLPPLPGRARQGLARGRSSAGSGCFGVVECSWRSPFLLAGRSPSGRYPGSPGSVPRRVVGCLVVL